MAETIGFESPSNGSNGTSNGHGGHSPGYTGRYIVSFAPGAGAQAAQLLENKAGVRAHSAREADLDAASTENVVFEEIGAAVVSAPPDQHQALVAAVRDTSVPVANVEPERVVWAAMLAEMHAPLPRTSSFPPRSLLPSGFAHRESSPVLPGAELAGAGLSAEFLRGYAAAIQGLLAALGEGRLEPEPAPNQLAAAGVSWGLAATRVLEAPQSGRGVRVAVLDTGMDLHHPDFRGRTIVSRSFVAGEPVQDGHGHGTHCVGTSCGPRALVVGDGYGVAHGAEIYVGKVLGNAGSGTDGGILAGINWAVRERCHVISMSLGAPVSPGEPFSRVYQDVAQAAEERGSLIVAAAGNESVRPGSIRPVGHPANCPTILAVGAVDSSLSSAWFSNGGVNPNGGEVNVAGPGVQIRSSWPMPQRYNTISGTSMATPHVAGIAALYAEATGLRGMALANHLLRRSRRMAPIRDFGWGLVQAV